jgi:hypothetical protein
MQRRLTLHMLALLAALVWMQATGTRPVEAQGGAPFCQPGQQASFVFGIAALHERLGTQTMGVPAECEHINAENGDTIQKTTTGLAYFRPSLNAAMFTDGNSHWALVENRLLMWRSDSVTPPQPTAAESAYLGATDPLRTRMVTLQSRVATIRQLAEAGQLDTVAATELRSLVDNLMATRNAFAATRVPSRLVRYHGMMVRSLNESMGAAEMLTQARQLEGSPLRADLVAIATKHRQESERLSLAAADAYSRALPIVVG